MSESKPIKLNEKKRTCKYPTGEDVELENVTELIIRDSGKHKLKTADKKLHIVREDWRHIVIDEEEWTI